MTAPLRPGPPTALTLRAAVTPTAPTEIGAVSFLLCGAPGSGKTEFACSLPAPLFFQWDSNMKTLEKHPGIPYVVPTDFTPEGESSSSLAFSERVLPLLEARRAHEIAGHPVESVVIDTGTELADDLATRIIGMKTNKSDSQARFGEFLREGHSLFRRIADLARPRATLPRYNVAVLFHLTDVTDEDGRIIRVAPAILGRLKGEIQRRFDVGLLLRCRSESAATDKPGVYVQRHHFEAWSMPPDKTFEGLAYDRVGGSTSPWKRLPPCITNPTHSRVISLWKGTDEEVPGK